MKRTSMLACAAAAFVAACGGGARQQPAATTTTTSAAPAEWDRQASAALGSAVAGMLADFDRGNVGAILARLDDDVILFDVDENNRPVRADGMAGARDYYGRYETARKTHDLRPKSKVVRSDCFATSTIGHCAIEFDQSFTMDGRSMGPYRYRATFVGRRRGPEWRFTHVHSSAREPIPPQT